MKRLKSALISMPWDDFQRPSLSIGCLSAYARSKGYDVEAFHFNLEAAANLGLEAYDEILSQPYCGEVICASCLFHWNGTKILKAIDGWIADPEASARKALRAIRKIFRGYAWSCYDLIGFTINHDQLFASLLFARWIKDKNPHVRVLFGGRSVAGGLGKSVLLNFSQVDWCVDGEGECPLMALLEKLSRGEKNFESKVPGLIYRQDDGVRINSGRQLPDLKGLPDPDFEHYFRLIEEHPTLRGREIQPYLPIEMSRGCSFNCAYCSERNFFKGLRHRPAGEISASLKRLFDLYRTSSVFLIAQMVTPKYCQELFDDIAAHGSDYRLFSEIRADLSKEDLRSLKRAGMAQVQIGIEALDTKLLRKMNKGIRLIDNLKIMKFCEEVGIRHVSNIIIGFPTETQGDLDRSIGSMEYAISYRPPTFFSEFALREGSLVYESPHKYDITEIDDASILGKFLPRTTKKNLIFWSKTFKSRSKRRDYRKFRTSYERWKRLYEEAESLGRPLLYYLNFKDCLRIEDFRSGAQSMVLDDWIRDLYLYCDEIRGFDNIRNRFPKVPEKELRNVLRKLFRLKVMYTEDDDWLSLAIHASPENRRHMPFL